MAERSIWRRTRRHPLHKPLPGVLAALLKGRLVDADLGRQQSQRRSIGAAGDRDKLGRIGVVQDLGAGGHPSAQIIQRFARANQQLGRQARRNDQLRYSIPVA